MNLAPVSWLVGNGSFFPVAPAGFSVRADRRGASSIKISKGCITCLPLTSAGGGCHAGDISKFGCRSGVRLPLTRLSSFSAHGALAESGSFTPDFRVWPVGDIKKGFGLGAALGSAVFREIEYRHDHSAPREPELMEGKLARTQLEQISEHAAPELPVRNLDLQPAAARQFAPPIVAVPVMVIHACAVQLCDDAAEARPCPNSRGTPRRNERFVRHFGH